MAKGGHYEFILGQLVKSCRPNMKELPCDIEKCIQPADFPHPMEQVCMQQSSLLGHRYPLHGLHLNVRMA